MIKLLVMMLVIVVGIGFLGIVAMIGLGYEDYIPRWLDGLKNWIIDNMFEEDE